MHALRGSSVRISSTQQGRTRLQRSRGDERSPALVHLRTRICHVDVVDEYADAAAGWTVLARG